MIISFIEIVLSFDERLKYWSKFSPLTSTSFLCNKIQHFDEVFDLWNLFFLKCPWTTLHFCYTTKSLDLTWRIWPTNEKKVYGLKRKKIFFHRTYIVLDDSSTPNTFSVFLCKESRLLISYLCQSIYLNRKFFSKVLLKANL